MKPLIYTFSIFFGLALVAILTQEKFFPNKSRLFYHCFELENTATRDWQSTEKAYEDKCNRESYDRVQEGSTRERDLERADSWECDHMS